MPLMVVFAMLWPRFRGVRGVEWRRGFGWTLPTRAWREIGFGFLGYLAGMPIVFVGILITALLNALSGAHPTHPIIQEVGQGGWPALGIFLLAAVWAPIVEETFFRGALFHSLRARWGWVVSALVSSLLFAGVHPQGWTVVPTLAALAIVFCGMRECRSSILASVTAHAMHNGATVLLMIFLMS